jgi:hypothetical protein
MIRSSLPVLSLAWLASCASPGADWNLAPLYSRHTAPQQVRAEIAGGLIRFEQNQQTTRRAWNPVYWEEETAGHQRIDFLFPFGRAESSKKRDRDWVRLWPFFWREAERRPDGVLETDWAFYPFFTGGSAEDGSEDSFAFFPFYGHLENWLSFEEVDFVLFPLWARTKKDGTQTNHFLFPLFSKRSGNSTGWKFFPLFGWKEIPGRSKSHFILWPFFTYSETELHKKNPMRSWFLFPFYGSKIQGDYQAKTMLWPFFGWANRPSTHYRSWQFWPLLKFEHSEKGGGRQLSRVLPFFLQYQDDQTEFTSLLWPIFWHRKDHLEEMERESWYAVPLFWKSKTKYKNGREEDYLRIFPFYTRRTITHQHNTTTQIASPDAGLAVSRNWLYPFSLWKETTESRSGFREKRAVFSLYRELRAAGHSRKSVPLIGGVWEEPDGTRHHSWLLGLIRWSSGEHGGWQAPAFPGPGWPDLSHLPIPIQSLSQDTLQ